MVFTIFLCSPLVGYMWFFSIRLHVRCTKCFNRLSFTLHSTRLPMKACLTDLPFVEFVVWVFPLGFSTFRYSFFSLRVLGAYVWVKCTINLKVSNVMGRWFVSLRHSWEICIRNHRCNMVQMTAIKYAFLMQSAALGYEI